jgi:hypothetical protein
VAYVLAAFVSLAFTGAAQAATPTLTSVDQQNRHPTATFSMPGADDATIYFATDPERASDGEFLEENVEELALLTADEIQAGRWVDPAQLDPGRYYVLLRAYDYDCPDDPSCVDGFSDVLTLTVPKPKPRYRGAVHAYRYLAGVRLAFKVTPLGDRAPYRVCWRLETGRRKCVRAAVRGYSWNSSAESQVTVSKRGMPRVARFTWYVGGRKVASKRARIPRPR